jgi:hypothetical protein
MTGRRRRVFPIAIALVATTLAGCTAQDAPFGIGITGYDPTLPDIPRGFSWEGPGRPKGRMSRQEVAEYRDVMTIAPLVSANFSEDNLGLPLHPITLDPISWDEWQELTSKLPPGWRGN